MDAAVDMAQVDVARVDMTQVDAGIVPLRRAAYADSGVFEAERARVFAGGWTALLFAHQLPDAGDQVPVEAAGLPLVAVRDRTGGVRVFHNVCRHRASLVVPEAVKAQPTLRCPYHGWAYGLDGALRATPLWDGQRVPAADAVDRGRLGLREVRCGVWSDVVWIDLSGAAPPLEDHVAPLTALWAGYDMGVLRLAHYETGQIEANWKLAIEASIENYHEPFVHEKLPARLDAAEPTFTEVADGAMFGFVTEADAALRSDTPLVPLHDAGAKRSDNLCYLFPNGQQTLFGGLAVRTIWVPLGVGRCEWRTSWYLVGAAADDAAHLPARETMVAFWRQLRAEDKRAIEWMQRGRASPVADDLMFSPFWERAIGTFHGLWRDRMGDASDA
jgi:choline monooxygenase